MDDSTEIGLLCMLYDIMRIVNSTYHRQNENIITITYLRLRINIKHKKASSSSIQAPHIFLCI